MATRIKKKVIENITKEKAEEALAEFSSAQCRMEELTAKMEQELIKVRENYQEELTGLGETISTHKEVLEVYARENRELFVAKKSFDMTHGRIGYRTGTPKIERLKGWKWDEVLRKVKDLMPDFIRTKEELNKEGIIASRETAEVKKQLAKCGMSIVQDETFFIEPKREMAA